MTIRCYIFDIDGTLADGSRRLHHILKQPKDWATYFSLCDRDEPIEHMRELAHRLSYFAQIVYVSGRIHDVREKTEAWLNEHSFPDGPLYMRAPKDHRDDNIVKIELLAQLRADGYEPIMAFDDRDRVVKAWREAGIPCAQVAPGDF